MAGDGAESRVNAVPHGSGPICRRARIALTVTAGNRRRTCSGAIGAGNLPDRLGGCDISGGVIVIALGVTLVGCAGQEGEQDRAAVDAMLEVEKVPGVLVAPYEHFVQIDPNAPKDEIVTTAVAVRDIVDGMGADRPRDLEIVAVYPGDPYVETKFSTTTYDDPDLFADDVRLWASFLDDGFTEVSYVTATEGVGPGTLAVFSEDPGDAGKTMAEAYAAIEQAVSEPPYSDAPPSLYASVDRASISNRSGRSELGDGWIELSEDLANLDYLTNSAVRLNPDETWVSLTGETDLTAEQTAQIMAALTNRGVLQPSVNVIYTNRTALPKDGKTTLYGVAE